MTEADTLPPLLITPEGLDALLRADMNAYQDRECRVALRALKCGLIGELSAWPRGVPDP